MYLWKLHHIQGEIPIDVGVTLDPASSHINQTNTIKSIGGQSRQEVQV